MKNEAEKERMDEIPVKKNISIKLKKAEPSGYPIAVLKDQMTKLGLTCSETSPEKLKEYKAEILKDFPKGKRQVYYISKGNAKTEPDIRKVSAEAGGKLNEVQILQRFGLMGQKVNGSWTIDDDAAGYRTELCRIVYAPNFDKLLEKHPGEFSGSKQSKKKVINEPTGNAIKDAFKTIAISVCETVMSGIALEDLETIVSCIIGDNTSENPKDYEQDSVLYSYLVNGYDGEESATAVGVLAVSYKIHIKDYKDKSDNKEGRHNDAEIEATARFISYSDIDIMERDLGYLDNDKKGNNPMEEIPVPGKKIVVYTERPNADKNVFHTGVPIVAPGAYADSMIFFCPDFENVGYIDNKDSDVTTTYSRSVTVGFSHASEYTISSEISMELSCDIVKYGVKMGVSMSMTEEWNQSQEETISYEVGAGKEAYLYQGKLKSIILRYDPAKNSFEYLEDSLNTFSTTSVKTTTSPIKTTTLPTE